MTTQNRAAQGEPRQQIAGRGPGRAPAGRALWPPQELAITSRNLGGDLAARPASSETSVSQSVLQGLVHAKRLTYCTASEEGATQATGEESESVKSRSFVASALFFTFWLRGWSAVKNCRRAEKRKRRRSGWAKGRRHYYRCTVAVTASVGET